MKAKPKEPLYGIEKEEYYSLTEQKVHTPNQRKGKQSTWHVRENFKQIADEMEITTKNAPILAGQCPTSKIANLDLKCYGKI